MAPKRTVLKGLVAGVVGATILALWFLIIDAAQGQPFHTPAFLARVLLNMDGAGVSPIVLYTLVHFAAFAGVGIAMAWLAGRLESCPPIVLGLILGFVLFDIVFYLGVLLTGADVVQELGWPQVLSGNLIAGVGLMVYLSRSLKLSSPDWLWALAQQRVVREGFKIGLIGVLTVMLWFTFVDIVDRGFLFTPGALGSALFLGATSVEDVQISLLTVGGYTIVHMATFFIVGLVAATIAISAERLPPLLLAGLLIFAAFEAFFLGMLGVVAEWLVDVLDWVTIGIGNLLGTLAIAYVLWQEHPKLRGALSMSTLLGDEDLAAKEQDN
jgi:hypothetical protein